MSYKLTLKMLLLGCLTALPFTSRAQSLIYRFEQLGNTNDLLLKNVSAIAQSPDGYIWFGASNGLYRYDGYNFKVYPHDEKKSQSISDNNINVIFFDKEGALWVGTRNGLNYYNSKSESFQKFLTHASNTTAAGYEIEDIREDGFGNYWIGTSNGGLYIFHNKKKHLNDSLSFHIIHYIHDSTNQFSISGNWVSSIYLSGGEYSWITTRNGINRFKIAGSSLGNLSFEHFAHDSKDKFSISDDDVWKVYEDPKKRLWFITLNGAINLLKTGSKIAFQHFSPLSQIKQGESAMLLDIFIDKKGRVWVASSKYGLLLFNLTELNGNARLNLIKKIDEDSSKNGLTNDFVWKIFEDKNGCLWIGTYQGINKYNVNKEEFQLLSQSMGSADLLGQNINCIYRDSLGNTLLGISHNNLLLLKPGRHRTIKFSTSRLSQEENDQNYAIVICRSKRGNLYVGTNRGLYIYSNDEVRKLFETDIGTLHPWYSGGTVLEKNTVLSLTEAADNNVYAGTGNGVYRINDTNFHLEHLLGDKELRGNLVIRSIVLDRFKDIWMGTDAGLLCYHCKDSSIDAYEHTIGDTSSLSNSLVQTIFVDKENSIWVGTQFGLNKFIAQTKTFQSYHVSNGLINEQISGITQDKKGSFWIASDGGLSSFNSTENKFHNYNVIDGLSSDHLTGRAIFCSADGMILIGSNEGINSFYPDSLYENTQPPPVYLTDFRIFTKSIFDTGYDKLRQAFNAGQKLVLNYQQNFFNISFVALNYLNTEKNQYAYMLQGVDHNWIYCGNNRTANYTDIAPGHYVFKVRAANNDGVWNEKGASIAITILPPWWKTWWFRTVFVLAVLSLIFFATRYYFAQKLKLQQEQFEKERAVENVRVKISQDIHDEIGSGLTKISLMSQRLKANVQNKKEVDPVLLDKITESSKEVIGNLGEIIWTVNPKHDNLQSLVSYLRNYISNFFEQTTIVCTINFPDEIAAVPVSPDLKHNLFLIIKEALNNIVKHAEASEVQVNFKLSEQTICFEIIDNGKGIADLKGRDFGNGLINMKSRMEAVNGIFGIESEKNKGTKIFLQATLL